MNVGYADYLRSPWWLAVREAKLAIAEYTCADCGYRRFPYKRGMPKRLEVHHLTYERLGCETPDDLVVLCEDCHAARHNLPPDPRPIAGTWWPIGALVATAAQNICTTSAAVAARRDRRHATNPHVEAGILDRREAGPTAAAGAASVPGADLNG